jgi:nucleotide-binding universal stress UspA family protein
MFTHILVPLDGSHLAEAAIPAAAYLANRLDAGVTLLHVIERDAPREVHGERHLTEPAEAEAYLEDLARRALPGVRCIGRHVHTAEVGDVARSLVEHVDELNPDLIVMCSHGQGAGKWLFGSIAQRVIARGGTPVLVISARPAAQPENFAIRRILVPVDGEPAHEQGLPVAAALARRCEAAVDLVMVVPTLRTLSGEWAATGRLTPGATRAVLECARAEAETHLAARVRELAAEEIPVTAEVRRGDPSRTIVDMVKQTGADLLVLGTHGKTGLDAFWAGSVAARIVNRVRIPMLLVPVREAVTPK